MKKIFVFLVLFFSFWNVYWNDTWDTPTNTSIVSPNWSNANQVQERNDACDRDGWCLDRPSFEINVSHISPWITLTWNTTSERSNNFLWLIIQRMMIALWILSVFIMTIWAWYIILHNWQDELLSKWKTIFMSWVYSMIIALTSYILIAIVRFLLFSTT